MNTDQGVETACLPRIILIKEGKEWTGRFSPDPEKYEEWRKELHSLQDKVYVWCYMKKTKSKAIKFGIQSLYCIFIPKLWLEVKNMQFCHLQFPGNGKLKICHTYTLKAPLTLSVMTFVELLSWCIYSYLWMVLIQTLWASSVWFGNLEHTLCITSSDPYPGSYVTSLIRSW